MRQKNKINLLENSKGKYLISTGFAGLYVGLGILLIFTIVGILTDVGSPMTKIMMAGGLNKGVSFGDVSKVWIYSFIGNLLGSIFVVFLFVGTGLIDKGPVLEFFTTTAASKASVPFIELFFRGVLCNILVCVAVLCSFRTIDDSAKLIIIFLCLFTFITAGFEHSVALIIGLVTYIMGKEISVKSTVR